MKKYANILAALIKSKEFQRFFIVGLSAFLLDFGLLNFQLYVLKFSPFLFDFISVPNLISSVISILFNFSLQRRWAFKSTNDQVIRESAKFFSVHGFNLIFFNGFLFGLIVMFGIPQPITKIIVTSIQLFASFALYKFFVFNHKKNIIT